MNAKAETRSISMEYHLPYPPAKVWRALTEPKLLAAWLMDNDMRPLAGHSFTFKAEPTPWWDGIVRCQVLEIEPHKRLRRAAILTRPNGITCPCLPLLETARSAISKFPPPTCAARASSIRASSVGRR